MPNIFILHTLQTIMGNKEKTMTITQELIEKYRAYSDAELMTTNAHIDGYSNEAKEALSKVLIEKGGLESLQKRIAEQDAINNEMLSIKHEIIELLNQGVDAFEIKTQINSTLISSIEIDLIIKETTTNYNFEKSDRKIKPKTIIGSLIGGLIGGTIGGVVWGIQMIYSGQMYFILVFGLAVLSYAFIWLFTKQSKKNVIVLGMTILSVIYALLLGQLIFEIIGIQK
jgi:hypothetical protein